MRSNHIGRSGFTLIELLVVIAIIAILAVVVVLVLNPQQLLAQTQDANRITDMATISSAMALYQADVSGQVLGTSSIAYTSLPDNTSSTCGDLGLDAMPSGYQYNCVPSASLRNVSSTGWIPVNFNQISSGVPFGSLPVDPVNSSSSHLYYTYNASGTGYEVTAAIASTKYQPGGSNDVISGDGGVLSSVYEKGTAYGLEPLDYGNSSLLGFWPFNEGTGTIAYDWSGNQRNISFLSSSSWQSGASCLSGNCFDATQYLYYAGTNPTGPYSNITVTGWLAQDSAPTSTCNTVDAAVGGFHNTYQIGIQNICNSTGYQAVAAEYGVGTTTITFPAATLGQWHFYAVTWSSQSGKLCAFMDGQQYSCVSAAFVPATLSALYIGAGGAGPLYDYTKVENIRLYSEVVPSIEINNIYNAEKGGWR